MRDHTKLRAFELADELVIAIYAATRRFPSEERFTLTSQLRRASISVASNIVEGCARSSEADFLHFLAVAFGSAREVEYQASLSHRLGYLTAREHESLRRKAVETCKVLGGLIRALRGPRAP